MGDSLWLAVCPRRDSMAPLVAGMYVDADGLQAWAVALGARDSSVAEVWFYPLASEKVVTFAGPILGSLVKEHQERETFARLKAKFEPAAAVVGVPGPVAMISAEVKPMVLVDLAVSPSITYPEIPKSDAPGVKFYEPPAVVTPEEPSPDGVAFLASMARGRRAALSEASCLAAARELYHKLGGYSTASAALAVADRAALLEAGIPSASIVGGP